MSTLAEAPSILRQGYDLSAIVFRSQRARHSGILGVELESKVKPLSRLETMFVRPVLEAPDAERALELARRSAPGFLHTLVGLLGDLFKWLDASAQNRRAFFDALDLARGIDTEPQRDDPRGTLDAWRCRRDVLRTAELWTDLFDTLSRVNLNTQQLTELASIAAYSDLLAFACLVGADDEQLATGPAFAGVAREAWHRATHRHLFTMRAVYGALESEDRQRLHDTLTARGDARLAELAGEGLRLEASSKVRVDLGDPVLGSYLVDIARLAQQIFRPESLEYREANDPEIEGVRWTSLILHLPPTPVDAVLELHHQLRVEIRRAVPDAVASFVVIDERLP